MSFFKLWEEKSKFSDIKIDLSKFKEKLSYDMKEAINSLNERKEKVKNFNYYEFMDKLNEFDDYPEFENLINACIDKKDKVKLMKEYTKFSSWLIKNNNNDTELRRDFWVFFDFISETGLNFSEKSFVEMEEKIIKSSESNMELFKKNIEEAITRISNWNNTAITIVAETSSKQIEESSSAYVEFGKEKSTRPSFLIFYDNNQIVIDDVLEGGDTDFFKDNEVQSDYFNLINELKNPNSTQKGKNLTLYTARPVEDRNYYKNTKNLSKNIFLTSSYNDAVGIAVDFEKRDVWKIVINSKYLVKTLDNNNMKHYQVVVDNAPIKSISMEHEWSGKN